SFFAPVIGVTDGPPVLGNYPTNAGQTPAYLFSPQQLGIEQAEIEVDGQVTEIGPEYSAGPVSTPGLADTGSHFVQLGAFLTPLNKGTHTVKVRFFADGAALAIFGGSFGFENVYTVVVK